MFIYSFKMQRIVHILQQSLRRYHKPVSNSIIRDIFYKSSNFNFHNREKRLCFRTLHNFHNKHQFYTNFTPIVLSVTILSWLGFADDDEQKESELIMTIKRAILCTQREQYEKAEQMLHLALRIAQQTHNEQGVTYCYDLMANLAFDQYELDKAEPLFVNVLQRLLSSGLKEDDLKVIHISLKLARICQLKAELEKADLGYSWCLEKIETQRESNVDAKVLYGIINDWYAQYLLDVGKITKATVHLTEAYNVCQEVKGKNDEKSFLLLNDLGISSFRAGDLDQAEKYLTEAGHMGRYLEDKTYLGVVLANLGLIQLEKKMFAEAERSCQLALKMGKKYDNEESREQAKYCFDQIKLNLGK